MTLSEFFLLRQKTAGERKCIFRIDLTNKEVKRNEKR